MHFINQAPLIAEQNVAVRRVYNIGTSQAENCIAKLYMYIQSNPWTNTI